MDMDRWLNERARWRTCDVVLAKPPPDQNLKDQGDVTGLLEAHATPTASIHSGGQCKPGLDQQVPGSPAR